MHEYDNINIMRGQLHSYINRIPTGSAKRIFSCIRNGNLLALIYPHSLVFYTCPSRLLHNNTSGQHTCTCIYTWNVVRYDIPHNK